jgi:hypothetical protein
MRNTECALQAVNNMALRVEKRVLLMQGRLKAESFKATYCDKSYHSGCEAPAECVMWESVKQVRQTGSANIPNRVLRSSVGVETRTAGVMQPVVIRSTLKICITLKRVPI